MTIFIRDLNQVYLKKITKLISDGGVISFPTETLYALAADATNSDAVEKIYQLKIREKRKLLPVLVADIKQASRIAEFDERAHKLAFKFFPGPLTLVLKLKPGSILADNLSQNTNSIAIRIPGNPIALKILQAIGRPIIGTSANISGHEPAIDAYEVMKYFENKIDLVVDGGSCIFGVGSTIVDLTGEKVVILRHGAIASKHIQETLDKI